MGMGINFNATSIFYEGLKYVEEGLKIAAKAADNFESSIPNEAKLPLGMASFAATFLGAYVISYVLLRTPYNPKLKIPPPKPIKEKSIKVLTEPCNLTVGGFFKYLKAFNEGKFLEPKLLFFLSANAISKLFRCTKQHLEFAQTNNLFERFVVHLKLREEINSLLPSLSIKPSSPPYPSSMDNMAPRDIEGLKNLSKSDPNLAFKLIKELGKGDEKSYKENNINFGQSLTIPRCALFAEVGAELKKNNHISAERFFTEVMKHKKELGLAGIVQYFALKRIVEALSPYYPNECVEIIIARQNNYYKNQTAMPAELKMQSFMELSWLYFAVFPHLDLQFAFDSIKKVKDASIRLALYDFIKSDSTIENGIIRLKTNNFSLNNASPLQIHEMLERNPEKVLDGLGKDYTVQFPENITTKFPTDYWFNQMKQAYLNFPIYSEMLVSVFENAKKEYPKFAELEKALSFTNYLRVFTPELLLNVLKSMPTSTLSQKLAQRAVIARQLPKIEAWGIDLKKIENLCKEFQAALFTKKTNEAMACLEKAREIGKNIKLDEPMKMLCEKLKNGPLPFAEKDYTVLSILGAPLDPNLIVEPKSALEKNQELEKSYLKLLPSYLKLSPQEQLANLLRAFVTQQEKIDTLGVNNNNA
ncbi:MAG: hypothetical protein K1000chlam2_00389 [Chlamydiae bacterium]|nr:hypothetical protein [Chlamydiota bacterium]